MRTKAAKYLHRTTQLGH